MLKKSTNNTRSKGGSKPESKAKGLKNGEAKKIGEPMRETKENTMKAS